MRKRTNNISIKIWLSILILVAGYFLSTIFGFVMGLKNKDRLRFASEVLFPAAKQGQLAVMSFREQIRIYSDVVLIGELNSLENATAKEAYVEDALRNIIELFQPREAEAIQKLLDRHKTFSKQAAKVCAKMASSLDSSEDNIENSMQLKKETGNLLMDFVDLESRLSLQLQNELAGISRQTERLHYLNLAAFFVVVISALSFIALIVSRSIVRPLKKTLMLEKAVEQSMDGVVVFSPDGIIRFMNAAWAEMHEFKAVPETTIHISTFHTPEQYQQELLPKLNILQTIKAVSCEINHLRQKGDEFPAMMTINRFEDLNGEINMVAIARDITEKKLSEKRIWEKTCQLDETLKKVEEANKRTMESLNYAKLIQRSILPGMDRVKSFLPNSFFIWMPKDIVGGDIFFTYYYQAGFVIALMDCTGHGVPGAFMTMIAYSGMRRIVMDEQCFDPARILQKLNAAVKNMLQKESDYTLSDDGLDAAVCSIQYDSRTLIFAGARIPLYYVNKNEVVVIKGDNQSLGYKDSNIDYVFTNHSVSIVKDMVFYLATDGFIDQLGGEKRRRFGTRRFKNLLMNSHGRPFEEQRSEIIQAFQIYKGENEGQDDVTVIGFQL